MSRVIQEHTGTQGPKGDTGAQGIQGVPGPQATAVASSLLTKTQYAGWAMSIPAYQWTQMVVDASLVDITGTDFEVQGNGTVKVVNAGSYDISANISSAEGIPTEMPR